jgi:hypothetical protein
VAAGTTVRRSRKALGENGKPRNFQAEAIPDIDAFKVIAPLNP